MKRSVIVFFVIALLSFQGFASAEEAAGYEQKIAKFFSMLQEKKNTEAVDFLYTGNPWMANVQDVIQQLKTQFVNLNSVVGEYRGNKKLAEKNIADTVYSAYYIAIYDRSPLEFKFTFYKPGATWELQSFAFSDDVSDKLDASVAEGVYK